MTLNGNSATGDPQSLGASLGPALREACAGRLGEIQWFRCEWQHGGAATGFAEWRDPERGHVSAMVKLPVGPIEYRWTSALGAVDAAQWSAAHALSIPTPRVLACGVEVGGYDIAWLVVERLVGATLVHEPCERTITELLRSAAEFQAAAASVRPIDESPKDAAWESLFERSRAAARDGGLHEGQRWNEAIKKAQKALPVLLARWRGRHINAWCHGDLHPANALRRGDQSGRCVLIDLALVHAGHWVEDAVYLERLYWGRPDQLAGVKPVSVLARCRRELGLPTDDSYGDVAMVKRALVAACAPAYAEHDGHPRFLRAALEQLEHALPQIH